jgi:hypothetical protein
MRQLESAIRDNRDRARLIDLTLRERRVFLPLGWSLSRRARQDIIDQIGSPLGCFTGIPSSSNACQLLEVARLLGWQPT